METSLKSTGFSNYKQTGSTMVGTKTSFNKHSQQRKINRSQKKKKTELIPQISDNTLLTIDILYEIINKSCEIGEFHFVHKKNQKKYENRECKNELNFISEDNFFDGNVFDENIKISKIIKKIINIDKNFGRLILYDFDTENYCRIINLNKFYEKDTKIIAYELYENVINVECKILLLYENFNFCTIDLIKLLNEENNDLINLENSKSEYFNFKPYLNIPDVNNFTPNLSNKMKILIFPKSCTNNNNNIVINFSQIAGKILLFNFLSFNIINNFIINPEDYSKIDNEYMTLLKTFLNKIFQKIWTLSQYFYFKKLIEDINNNKKDFSNYKKLTILILTNDKNLDYNEFDSYAFPFLENEFLSNIKKENNYKNTYNNLILPIILYSLKNDTRVNIFLLLNKIIDFFDKIYNCSISSSKNDLTLINGKFKIYQLLFLQCFNRNINLEKLFKEKDTNNSGYLSYNDIYEILNNLPIGITNDNINEILSTYYLFDENNNFMFNYLLLLEEQQITQIVFTSSLNLIPNNRYQCGFFINDQINIEEKQEFNINNENIKKIKRKDSFDFDYYDPIEEDESFKENDNNIESNFNFYNIIQYLINSCFQSEITDIIYLENINMLFLISPYSYNISIFKYETSNSLSPRILNKIGEINLNSAYEISPKFIDFIPERNLLISQRFNKFSCDIILIDIYNDIISNQDSEKFLNIELKDKNIIEDQLSFDRKAPNNLKNIFINFKYLINNELFLFYSNNDIIILNPKSQQYELSFRLQSPSEYVYSKICKDICETPSEKVGKTPYFLIKSFYIKPGIKNISIFSLGNILMGNNYMKKNLDSNLDYLIIITNDNKIFTYSIIQKYIKQKAKEIDNPIPPNELEKIYNKSFENLQYSLNKYDNIFLNNIENYYNIIIRNRNENLLDILNSIKEHILYKNKKLQFNPHNYKIEDIHLLIRIMKNLNLKIESNNIINMYPKIQTEELLNSQNEEYYKTELFPDVIKNYSDENKTYNFFTLNIPKMKNLNTNLLSNLKTNKTPYDSAIKKLCFYAFNEKIRMKNFFEKIDINNEDIINYKQFYDGIDKLGLISNNYLYEIEIESIFKKMDIHKTNHITNDEFIQFFDKLNYKTIFSIFQNELNKRKMDFSINFDYEEFFEKMPENVKFERIKNIFNKIKEFYNEQEKTDESTIKNIMIDLSKHITKKDINYSFSDGFIFYDQFKKFLNLINYEIDEETLKKIFCYFDYDNKNLFIYTNYFNEFLHNNEDGSYHQIDLDFQYNEFEFLLIWLSILKKLLKYCLITLEILPENFTEQCLLSKKFNKNIVILDYIPTLMLKEDLEEKKLNFNEYQKKLLYDYYLDIYNFGILFKYNLNTKFDNILKFINDSNIFDFKKYDIFNGIQNGNYINEQKRKLEIQKKYFNENYLKDQINIFDINCSLLTYFIQLKFNDINNLFNYIKTFDENKDNFLTQKEFESFLKIILPSNIYTNILGKSLINQFSEYYTFINEPTIPYININRFILYLIYNSNKNKILNQNINHQDLTFSNIDDLYNSMLKTVNTIELFNKVGNNLLNESFEFLNNMKKNIYSGIVILNKYLYIDKILNKLNAKDHKILDYLNYYMNISNDIIVDKFLNRMKNSIKYKTKLDNLDNVDIHKEDDEEEIEENNEKFQKINNNEILNIEIPIVRINIIDTREMLNRKIYQCNMIENFDFFHTELQCIVNITKIRKSFLLQEISSDGKNLLEHILFSLKVNHYLQKNDKDNLFVKNFGIFFKQVIINKKLEEELFIVNEKVDKNEFISMFNLIKNNGGLLQIPEYINSDMTYYIIRYWGKIILDILLKFHNLNISLKFFNLKDFYLSYDGKRIKMNNILTYFNTNDKGEILNGPDLIKILILLDNVSQSDFSEIDINKLNKIYSNSFLPPEFFIHDNFYHTNKMDVWNFGMLLFNILFGFLPESFYEQLKNWCKNFTNLNFENVIKKFPRDIIGRHFFYNPFSNVKEIIEDKFYFIKVLKLKSFSGIINKKYINLSNENNKSLNGLGLILDLINSCLHINSNKRPNLNILNKFFLFNLNEDEEILCSRFLDNALTFYSPEIIVIKNMVIPLRNICCNVIKNEESNLLEVNNYENYILNVIEKLFEIIVGNKEDELDNNEIFEEKKNSEFNFVKNPSFFYKNSEIIKCIIDNKVFDLLNFLILRHFYYNLKLFQQTYEATSSLDYYTQMKNSAGYLISHYIILLNNCIGLMNSYDNTLSLYVEDILIYIIKIFIGEENNLLSTLCDYRDSEDELKKYILLRTFQRSENIILSNGFVEDELDRVFSVRNINKELHEIPTYWCHELYYLTIDLFKEAFGENCSGNYKYIVIKNYFMALNDYSINIENPLLNHNISDYVTYFGNYSVKLTNDFVNSSYVNEILKLSECQFNILKTDNEEIKLKTLKYINTLFKGKNQYKIRACFDYKIHFIIQKFLFTYNESLNVKKEIYDILKEISINLINLTEIGWIFGNNYKKNEKLQLNENIFENGLSNWTSNFNLINFMKKILENPYCYILYYSNRFSGIKNKKNYFYTFMKEFGLIFSSPLSLKPLMRILQRGHEDFDLKLNCLEILFNLLLSNDKKIIFNFNMSTCNFYEILIEMLKTSIKIEKNNKKSIEKNEKFKSTVKDIIDILLKIENPYIISQIYSSPSMLKYMEEINYNFIPKLEIEEIENEINKTKDIFNFTDLEDKILFLIMTFKTWLFNSNDEIIQINIEKIKLILNGFIHIFDSEFEQGYLNNNKNNLIFNIVKLFDWIFQKNLYEKILFPLNDINYTMNNIINFCDKIKLGLEKQQKLIINLNKNYNINENKLENKSVKKNLKNNSIKINPFKENKYICYKIYNFILIKLQKIIFSIFDKNDDNYNDLFLKIKFGKIFSEIICLEYQILSLFLSQENIDITILDNYMIESNLRLKTFDNIINLTNKFDEIKSQLLKNEFINFLFKNLIYDFRSFRTDYSKLSLEFIKYKKFPLRTEAMKIINTIIKKYYSRFKTKVDSFIYDEMIRNIKITRMVQNELAILRNKLKGDEIYMVLSLFNIVIRNDDREIIKIMNEENAKDYFVYSVQQETNIKKLFPFIIDYIKKVEAGIENK